MSSIAGLLFAGLLIGLLFGVLVALGIAP